MSFTIPNKTTVIITARRLGGAVQPASVLIGPANQITYDFVAMGSEPVVLERTNITPSSRIVSPAGVQVEVQAAEVGDEATLEILPNIERLFVRESLVFREC